MKPPMEKNTTNKQRKQKPKRYCKQMPFDEALELLRRKHKVARKGWFNVYLELAENDRGDRYIVEKTKSSSQAIVHNFDQVEILAVDWIRLVP